MTRDHERLEQVRTDIRDARRGVEVAPLPVAPGRILLATPHVPTEVRLRDIDEVRTLPKTTTLGLRGLVTLRDGTRYFVPNAADVLRAMKEALR